MNQTNRHPIIIRILLAVGAAIIIALIICLAIFGPAKVYKKIKNVLPSSAPTSEPSGSPAGSQAPSQSSPISFAPMGLVLGAPAPAGVWQDVSTLGAKWARTQIRWDQIEKTQGNFDYSVIDATLASASKTNTKLMTIVSTSPKNGFWAVSACEADNPKAFCVPNDLSGTWNNNYGYSQSYYNYVNQLASHTKGKIDHFVIQNEVASPRFWSGTPDEYLKLRKTAYQAIHDANTNAVVIDNGLASPVWGLAVGEDLHQQGKDQEALIFVKTYFARSSKYSKPLAKINSWNQVEQEINKDPELQRTMDYISTVFQEQDSFDWFNFHFYDPVSCYPQVISYIKARTSKPVMMNEGGYASSVKSADPNLVAGDLVKLYLITVINDLKQFEWYPTQENPSAQDTASISSLFDKNGKILPAGEAWKFLNSLLGTDAKVAFEARNNAQVYKIERGEKTTYVVWADQKTTLKASDLGMKSLTIYDAQGNKTGSGDSVSVDSAPQYLR